MPNSLKNHLKPTVPTLLPSPPQHGHGHLPLPPSRQGCQRGVPGHEVRRRTQTTQQMQRLAPLLGLFAGSDGRGIDDRIARRMAWRLQVVKELQSPLPPQKRAQRLEAKLLASFGMQSRPHSE